MAQRGQEKKLMHNLMSVTQASSRQVGVDVRPDGSIVERYANATDGITLTSNYFNSYSTSDRDDQVHASVQTVHGICAG